ncbi:hypothetical protein AALP_AA1G309100 [Arabis alpina]|uniref:Uncharacterized protein n=1 Tax=Arabis alpina TaxID=50452 RepID=A0A087HRT7_ARAAL|nr:hypothetical protein AALP_AA1G309100 [Arabis alpina]
MAMPLDLESFESFDADDDELGSTFLEDPTRLKLTSLLFLCSPSI